MPSDCTGFVAGRRGHVLRCIEDDWDVLMFFLQSTGDKTKVKEAAAKTMPTDALPAHWPQVGAVWCGGMGWDVVWCWIVLPLLSLVWGLHCRRDGNDGYVQ